VEGARERIAAQARSAGFEVARRFAPEKEPLKPEAQAKVIGPRVFPSLALQASIDFATKRLDELARSGDLAKNSVNSVLEGMDSYGPVRDCPVDPR
jgi:hypothetical protein